MKYGIRTETITIDQEVYKLSPLKGKFYADFMELATTIDNQTKKSKRLSPDTKEEDIEISLKSYDYELMCMLCTESLLVSDNGADRSVVEQFVSQNLMLLIPVLMKVNNPK